MSYSYTLMVLDDDGNPVVEHYLSPDEAVMILADALTRQRSTGAPEFPDEKLFPTRKNKEKAEAHPAGKRRPKCSICGKPGHNVMTCPDGKGKHPNNTPEPTASTKASEPLFESEYDELREAMLDREFQSAKYALVHKLSPREVNAAVRSADYADYLDDR
jgi:hypothetical protein